MRLKKLCTAILTIALFGFYGSTAISDPTRPNGPTAAGVFGEAARCAQTDAVTGSCSTQCPLSCLQRGAQHSLS